MFDARTGTPTILQQEQGQSVDVLSISCDGKFLAAAGQSGTVKIWQIAGKSPDLLTQLEQARVWVDRLQWNPRHPELAFSVGRYVQVWDARTQTVITTLNLETSSVLDLAWHPQGEQLSVSGNQSVKTWHRQDWDDDPIVYKIGGASVTIAWSPNGTYLASGNNDRTLLVWEQGNPYPWQMQGFPGKVRQLAWSTPITKAGAPILASISAEGIVSWTKDADPSIGWNAQVLNQHRGRVTAIGFQPKSLLLASTAEDGQICLWNKAKQIAQILQGLCKGFSNLSWNFQGTTLATGGQQGEVVIWKQQTRGKGFS
nr:hypothetical protein [Gloeomargarita lithophora]